MNILLSNGGARSFRRSHCGAFINDSRCRRGLARFLEYAVNHPIIRGDGILGAFLTESSFEQWRKNASITLDEESTGKRIDPVEEMAIPSDLDDKLQ
jgi:sorting nexin-8